MRRPWPALGRSTTGKKYIPVYCCNNCNACRKYFVFQNALQTTIYWIYSFEKRPDNDYMKVETCCFMYICVKKKITVYGLPSRSTKFLSSERSKSDLRTYQLLFSGYWVYFLGAKQPGRETICLLLLPRLWMSGAVPLFPLYDLITYTGSIYLCMVNCGQ
jgi:hypothetical protein